VFTEPLFSNDKNATGSQGSEMWRLPHCPDNRLTDGGQAVGLSRGPAALCPQEDYRYSFLLEAESIPGPHAAGRRKSIAKCCDVIWCRTCNFEACRTVPQPMTLPRASHDSYALHASKCYLLVPRDRPQPRPGLQTRRLVNMVEIRQIAGPHTPSCYGVLDWARSRLSLQYMQ
jgi:hypothetical protein